MTNIVHDDDIRASPIPHNISTTSATPVGEDLTTLSRDELVLKLQAARNTIDENGRDLIMAAQVGQQLLKVNQSLKKAYDQLALDTASSQTNQTTSTFNNSTEFTPSKFTQPSSFPHSSSPKTPKTPQFDLHAYIDSLESTNHSLKLDLDRTVSETMNKTRKINKLEKELILARDEMHQLQMDMEQDSRIKQRIDVKHAMGSMRDQTGILLDSLYAQVDALTREKKACEQSNRSLQEELHEIKIQVECLEQQEVQDKKSIFSKESELLSLRKLWKQQKRQLMQLRHELETERQDRLKASARIIDRVLGPCEEVSRVVDNPRSPSRWLSLRNASSEELIAQFWNPEAELLPKDIENSVHRSQSLESLDSFHTPEKMSGASTPGLVQSEENMLCESGMMHSYNLRSLMLLEEVNDCKTKELLPKANEKVRLFVTEWINYLYDKLIL